MSVLDSTQKQASLGSEIARALNPTAFGVFLSMVILVGYYMIRGMALRLTERMHYGVAVISNLLVPAEVTSFMPISMPAAPVSRDVVASPVAQSSSASSPNEGASQDANVADTSAENIRDEEEII